MHRVASIALAVIVGGVSAAAQTPRPAPRLQVVSGIATTVTDNMLTVRLRDADMTFAVPGSARIVGKGLASDLVLRSPPHLRRLVKFGDRVRVTFRRSGRTLQAVEVRILERAM